MSLKNIRSSLQPKRWIFAIPLFLMGSLFTLLLERYHPDLFTGNTASRKPSPNEIKSKKGYTVCRPKEYSHIKPLAKEQIDEAAAFLPLKHDLKGLIDSLRKAGMLTQASVYFREFDNRDWIAVNRDEQYHPASLMKVALLIAYLRNAQANPAMLKQELTYNTPPLTPINTQFYPAPAIEPVKKYTIHELLYYMIANSDNHATWVLASHFDQHILKKLFADFCLPEPVGNDLSFTLTAKEFSVFVKTIYTSSCLSPEFSEYAAQLMSNCHFKDGFVRGLPKDTRMWHKFGEWRSPGHDFELHESGIVFVDDEAYLLTVMTRGKDTNKQAAAISAIARKVYEHISPP